MVYALLTFPSTLVVVSAVFLQWGRTPLLMAAFCGRNAFIDVLMDKYHCSVTDVDNVSDN